MIFDFAQVVVVVLAVAVAVVLRIVFLEDFRGVPFSRRDLRADPGEVPVGEVVVGFCVDEFGVGHC